MLLTAPVLDRPNGEISIERNTQMRMVAEQMIGISGPNSSLILRSLVTEVGGATQQWRLVT